MRVLVVGGCGFIGSHIADAFVERDCSVTVLDRQVRVVNTDVNYIEGDIFCEDSLRASLREQDLVVHSAGFSDLDEGLNNPLETIRLNIEATVRLMDAARHSGVSTFCFCSSVYADSGFGGFYGCSKRAAESYIIEYSRRFQFNCRIYRFGTVYGRRSNAANGLYRIVKGALLEGEIIYHGNIEAMRDYIHVIDAAELVVDSALGVDEPLIQLISGIERVSIKNILNILSEILGIDAENIVSHEDSTEGHYTYTAYQLDQTKPVRKRLKANYIEIGSGLHDLCVELKNRIVDDGNEI